MTQTMWIIETTVNTLLFVYIGVLIWLYTRAEDDEENAELPRTS